MKKLLSILIFLVAGISGWSQPGNPNNLVIYGNVKNISNGNPIKNHRVYANKMTPGSAYAEFRMTDSLGNYRFDVPDGSVVGPNIEYRVLTYDCDSVPHVQEFSNEQGSVDVKNINFEICKPERPECRALFNYSISPANPLRVIFQNLSAGENLSFLWSINGNIVSELREPELTMPSSGEFTVCLQVKSNDSIPCQDYFCRNITVDGAPNYCDAHYTISYTPGAGIKLGKPVAPFSNNFTYTWVVNHHTIQEYAPQLPLIPGGNRICLYVTDGAGCSVGFCDSLFVPIDTCSAQFSHLQASNIPNKIVFTNLSAGEKPNTNYYWTFGDGAISTDISPEHIYQAPGTYLVCLRMYSESCLDSICKEVVVQDIQNFCNAAFQIQTSSAGDKQGKPLAPFSNNFTYTWTINNITVQNYDPHFNTIPGWNKVCLYVSDGGSCHVSHCDSLYMPPDSSTSCVAYFSYLPSSNNPNRIIFTNHSQGGSDTETAFHWNFGDGSFAETQNGEHTFSTPGIYTVCLLMQSTNCTDSICKVVTIGINQIPCDADFTFENFRIAPASVQFNSKPGQTAANGFIHIWYFGNDTVHGNPSPSHQFMHPGVYNVCHKIINSSMNCEQQECKTVNILAGDSTHCEAHFAIISSNATMTHFYFQNQSTGIDSMNLQVKWIFGDGTPPSLSFNAEHTYTLPGTYTVCLYIQGPACNSYICKTIVVQGNPDICNADFQWNRLNNDNPYKIAFHANNSSNVNMNHVWKFSNTNQSELPNPVFTFPGPGTYTVCHYLYNPAGSCRDTVCKQIVLLPLPNDSVECHAKYIWFTSEENAQKVIFKNMSTAGQYSWSFGDSTYSTDVHPQHTYSSPGSYQVCLKVQRSNCTDIFCSVVNVGPGNTERFTIGGQIFAGAHNADVAKVNLIRRDPVSMALSVFRTTLVDSSGRYTFVDIPSGVYLIRAGLLQASAYFNFYVPTYFGSQFYWQFAEPVVVNADGDTYNIALIYGGNNGGPGGVGGGINGPIRMDGPVNQATVIVTNLSDGPQRWTETDETGQFSIGNLAYGTYRLWADYEGMVCVPIEFTISAENPEVAFSLNMGSEITIISEAKKVSLRSELYPNPASTMVSMDLFLNNSTALDVQLINLTGQCMLQKGIHIGAGLQQVQIPVSSIPAGIYFVCIRDASSNSLIGTRKLTITR